MNPHELNHIKLLFTYLHIYIVQHGAHYVHNTSPALQLRVVRPVRRGHPVDQHEAQRARCRLLATKYEPDSQSRWQKHQTKPDRHDRASAPAHQRCRCQDHQQVCAVLLDGIRGRQRADLRKHFDESEGVGTSHEGAGLRLGSCAAVQPQNCSVEPGGEAAAASSA